MKDFEEPPLFDTPAPPPKRKRVASKSTKATYARIRPKGRVLCDDCCQEIHRLGQFVAPLPRRATWSRRAPEDASVLCQAHKDERHDHESA